MSFANKRNKGSRFNIDTSDFQFKKVRDLENDRVYPVHGVVCFKTKYGDSPAAILSDCFVNLPKHMADDIISILNDDEDVNAIKSGAVGLKRRDYTGKDGNQYTGVEWVDIK